MQSLRRAVSCAVVSCLAAVACQPQDATSAARARLASALRDSLGRSSDANVGVINHGSRASSHLYVMLDTAAVPNVSDSAFAIHARAVARFAVRHYDNASTLDSVTVATREPLQPGVWKVHHKRAFAVAGLSDSSAP